MKRFLVLFAMVAFVGTIASAQTLQKSTCTKTKAACTKTKAAAKTVSTKEALPSCCVAAAAKLASMDENIESKTCAKSGKVSYYQKSVCATSGKLSMKPVKYCKTSKAFVNVAPTQKVQTLKASKVSTTKKACSKSKKACKKTCSKTKAKATTQQLKAKQVKFEENK